MLRRERELLVCSDQVTYRVVDCRSSRHRDLHDTDIWAGYAMRHKRVESSSG